MKTEDLRIEVLKSSTNSCDVIVYGSNRKGDPGRWYFEGWFFFSFVLFVAQRKWESSEHRKWGGPQDWSKKQELWEVKTHRTREKVGWAYGISAWVIIIVQRKHLENHLRWEQEEDRGMSIRPDSTGDKGMLDAIFSCLGFATLFSLGFLLL